MGTWPSSDTSLPCEYFRPLEDLFSFFLETFMEAGISQCSNVSQRKILSFHRFLSGNNIHTIEAEAFSGLSSLKYL